MNLVVPVCQGHLEKTVIQEIRDRRVAMVCRENLGKWALQESVETPALKDREANRDIEEKKETLDYKDLWD